MGSELVKSRWQYQRCCRIDSLLKALGIEFRRVVDQDFWQANSHLLPQLFQKLEKVARLKFKELHPDVGGDATEFDAFRKCFDRARRQFRRALSSPVVLPQPGILIPKRTRAIINAGLRKNYANRKAEGRLKKHPWTPAKRKEYNANARKKRREKS